MTITPTLDDATRADENPISNGGIWTTPALPLDFNGALLANVIRSGGAGWGSGRINTIAARDIEIWATISASASTQNQMFYRLTNPNTTNATRAFYADFQPSGNFCQWGYVFGNGNFTPIENISMVIDASDKCSVQAIGNKHYFFIDDVLRATRTCDSHQVPGYLGFRGWQTASQGWANFGGGQLSTLDPIDTSSHPKRQLAGFALGG